MAIITAVRPLPAPVQFADSGTINMRSSPGVRWLGALVIALTIALYIYFW